MSDQDEVQNEKDSGFHNCTFFRLLLYPYRAVSNTFGSGSIHFYPSFAPAGGVVRPLALPMLACTAFYFSVLAYEDPTDFAAVMFAVEVFSASVAP